ncbi:hypothetical protein HanPSC8_Chr01g0008721 [Helianthus annuus]|nr:hypothetical protein HanPSC8_Chr01g0008721 [Helianthus annuus]
MRGDCQECPDEDQAREEPNTIKLKASAWRFVVFFKRRIQLH